ncbi:MAG: hypothetical protein HY320_11210 [Armatimonadetes bacterium]|nr:hypothetical protein [Armatimonadota bacterium]
MRFRSSIRSAVWLGVAISAMTLSSPAAGDTPEAVRLMPPAAEAIYGGPEYTRRTRVDTRRHVWKEKRAYPNFAQTVTFRIRLPNARTRCEILARPAWDPSAPWERIGGWRGGPPAPREREVRWSCPGPILLLLRVRGTRVPFGGRAVCEALYRRRSVAVRRGSLGRYVRPVLILEGFDPTGDTEFNDPSWMDQPDFARLLRLGMERYDLDPWVVDWGWGGADLREQGREFVELARAIDHRSGGYGRTVVVALSTAGVAARFGLAEAYDSGLRHGVRTLLTLAAPHRGVVVNEHLWNFLLQAHPAFEDPHSLVSGPEPGSESYEILTSPAAQQTIQRGLQFDDFMADLRSRGKDGYDPRVIHIGFASSNFGNLGDGTARIRPRSGRLINRVRVSLLGLPIWFTLHRVRSRFRYDHYPGDQPPSDLQRSYREHRYLFGILRVDARIDWPHLPTFVPTHSALDFPETLVQEGDYLRYASTRSPFRRCYIKPGRQAPHDRTLIEWVDAATGQPPPGEENAVLYEVARSFQEAEQERTSPLAQPQTGENRASQSR